MDVVVGTLILPRASASSGKPGEVFFVRVLAPVGPGRWLVEAGGRTLTIATTEKLTVGQSIALRLVPAPPAAQPPMTTILTRQPDAQGTEQALSAFVRQGLPLIPAQLRRLDRWLERSGSALVASETQAWSAALAARSWPDLGPANEALAAWLQWESALSQGSSLPPPQDDFWDLWNSLPAQGNVQQVGVPFQWECEETLHWALLKAEFAHPTRAPMTWSVLSAVWNLGFRVGWRNDGERAVVIVRLFDPVARERLAHRWQDLTTPLLTAFGHTLHLTLESGEVTSTAPMYRPGALNAQA